MRGISCDGPDLAGRFTARRSLCFVQSLKSIPATVLNNCVVPACEIELGMQPLDGAGH